MLTKSPQPDEVAGALAEILRRGLPVTAAAAGPVLLCLRGVIARAVDPNDDASRTAALDGVLRGQLARFPDSRYADAARALFALSPAETGQNITTRRAIAAEAAGHEVHYFRKRAEHRLLEQLAGLLLADADRFTHSRVIAPRLAPPPGRQIVLADPFAWEVAEHEETLSRLWAAIYALRAELLAAERLLSLGAERQQVVRQAVTAAWGWGQASAAAIGYTTAFANGPAGATSADDLVVLAGWTPPLTGEQSARLRTAAAAADRAEFVATMHNDTDLGHTWVDAFTPTFSDDITILERHVS